MTLVTQLASHREPECQSVDTGDLIERSRVLNDRLRFYDQISEIIESAQLGVSEDLDLLFPTYMKTGKIRNGTILRDCIEVMARRAEHLVDEILNDIGARSRTPDVIQKIREGFVDFIEFLDGALEGFVERVESELECAKGSQGISLSARKVWAEHRDGLLDTLEHGMEISRAGQGPRNCEFNRGAGGGSGDTSPPKSETVAAPAFELVGQIVGSSPSSPMRDLVLEGQQVKRVQFQPELAPTVVAAAQDTPEIRRDWFEAWTDLIVNICSGKVRPNKQAEWRGAFEDACSRQQIKPDAKELDAWAHLVWRKLITSRHVLSDVQKAIRLDAETSDCGDYGPSAFSVNAPLSMGSSSFEGGQGNKGSAAIPSIGIRRSAPSPLANEGQDTMKNQPPGGVFVNSSAIGLAAPVVHID